MSTLTARTLTDVAAHYANVCGDPDADAATRSQAQSMEHLLGLMTGYQPKAPAVAESITCAVAEPGDTSLAQHVHDLLDARARDTAWVRLRVHMEKAVADPEVDPAAALAAFIDVLRDDLVRRAARTSHAHPIAAAEAAAHAQATAALIETVSIYYAP